MQDGCLSRAADAPVAYPLLRMRALRPLLAPMVLVLFLVVASCGGDDGGAAADVTIAFLRAVETDVNEPQAAFIDELEAAGYVEGENLTLVASDPSEVHAEESDVVSTVETWVEDGVDLIVALSSSGARAAGPVAGDVPVLFLSTDPTATGLVTDERAPDGNMTGATFRVPADRTLAVAADALGDLDRIGCLYPSTDPAAEPSRLDIEQGAEALGIDVACVAFDDDESAAAVDEVVAIEPDAVLLANAPSTVRAFPDIGPALEAAAVPVVANTDTPFAVLVLQPDVVSLYRQMAGQAVRLLEGAEVSETPVEDPGSFELVVNLGVAEQLGIDIPEAFVERADRVIR